MSAPKRRPVMACRSCTQVQPTKGRGLCRRCYAHHDAAGTLDQFEPLNAARNTGKPSRPFRECPWCTRTHRSATEACLDCCRIEAGLDEIPDPDDALPRGQWVVVGGVRRFITNTEELTAA